MGKRKTEDINKIKKKIEKWQKRLKRNDEVEKNHTTQESPDLITEEPATPGEDLDVVDDEILSEDEVPEELLLALGPEGVDTLEFGDPIQQQLANRWTNIMRDGLKKDTREELYNKYLIPKNFAATAPVLNPEVKSVMSEKAIKRDNRFIHRQNLTGKVIIAIGKTLTNIMKRNINSKDIVENLSNAAKMGAELFHQDTMSRKYFALGGTSPLVRDALRNEKPDNMIFGKDCSEKIKSAQTIQRTGAQIRNKKENYKSPLLNSQKSRNYNQPRSGQYNQPRGGQYNQPRSGHYNQPRSYQQKPQQKSYRRNIVQKNLQRKRSPPQRTRYQN